MSSQRRPTEDSCTTSVLMKNTLFFLIVAMVASSISWKGKCAKPAMPVCARSAEPLRIHWSMMVRRPFFFASEEMKRTSGSERPTYSLMKSA